VAAGTAPPEGMRFTPRDRLGEEPLPGAMKKVLAHALTRTAPVAPAPAAPPPEPDLATPPEPEPRPRRAPVPKVLPRRPASAAPIRKDGPRRR
jgi:A/G-specific adenine glycosylase